MGGGLFIMGDVKFLKSLYIVGRRVLTPLFYEDLPYISKFPFFKFFPPPPPPLSLLSCHLQPLTQLLFLLTYFFGSMSDHVTFDILFYLMIISIYKCQVLLL